MRHHGAVRGPLGTHGGPFGTYRVPFVTYHEVTSDRFRDSGLVVSFVSKSTRYMFFDTETSGLPRQMDAPVARLDNWPRVVQLAWILTDFQGRVISERQFLIRPGQWRMQPGALRVHGITLRHARQHGRPLSEVLNRFALDLLQTDSIIGHNVQFDQKILGAEFLRVGQTNPLQKRHAQCTMKIGASFLQRQHSELAYANRAGSEASAPWTNKAWATDNSITENLEVATSVEATDAVETGESGDAVAEPIASYRVDPPSPLAIPQGAAPKPSIERATPVEGATWRDSNTGFRYPSLRRLYRTLFGNDFDNAHDALADTQACMNCFFRMYNLRTKN